MTDSNTGSKPTGLPALDAQLPAQGWKPGDALVVAATGKGKSILTRQKKKKPMPDNLLTGDALVAMREAVGYKSKKQNCAGCGHVRYDTLEDTPRPPHYVHYNYRCSYHGIRVSRLGTCVGWDQNSERNRRK